MIPFPLVDISQYEFEEFCNKWMFDFYEKSNGGRFDTNKYSEMWNDFDKINALFHFKYSYVTSLNTRITFRRSTDSYLFWEFKTEQLQ